MKAKDEKSKLYERLVQDADPVALLERMRALGFWPHDEEAPREPAEARAERERLDDELERLRRRGVTASDPDKALQKERLRRWHESKARRAAQRAQREHEAAQRRDLWEEQRRGTIVHAGDGVSAGLQERESSGERLAAQGLPQIDTPESLAEQMGIGVAQLRWLTYHRTAAGAVHYRRYGVPKKSGGVRHISAPKPELAFAQRWLFEHVLTGLSLPAETHGFVTGKTTLSNARPHVGKAVVVNMDLRDFFPTITFQRVKGLFSKLGYSGSVATVMALLTTEPPRVAATLDGRRLHVALGERRLPQGACTSPVISNLVCRRLDRRLRGFATSQGFTYTRYADDLTFSSEDDGRVGKLLGGVRRIVEEEGFVEHEAKTHVMRRGACQTVTGLTVNDRVGLSRKKRRELRAVLHNVSRHGLASQNRAAHPRFDQFLRGWVAYLCMVDPDHAEVWRGALARALTRPPR
ncbi:MAG: reverse transcriptase family protein [Polyangiales bacterium]